MEYLYSLEKGSKKHRCPGCNKKSFVRYVNNETGDYLPAEVGRCDREQKCGYHMKPEKPERAPHDVTPQPVRVAPLKPKKQAYLPEFILNRTQSKHEKNVFLNNLKKTIPAAEVEAVRGLYSVGTISRGYRAGAVSFPYIDTKGRINSIQVKQFGADNHTTKTGFVHTMVEAHYKKQNKPLPDWLKRYVEQDRRINCLFGAHLLPKYPNNPVALVEAPKTAIIGTLYFGSPAESESNFIWLATYNKSSFQKYKCEVLAGRHVAIFPDLGALNDWSEKAADIFTELSGATFTVSDLLETSATEAERKDGLDIADYLTKHDWEQFRNPDKNVKNEALKTKNKKLPEFEPRKKAGTIEVPTNPAELMPEQPPQPQTTTERTAIDPLKVLPRNDNFSAKTASEMLVHAGIDPNEAEMKITELLKTKKITHLHTGGYYVTESTPF